MIKRTIQTKDKTIGQNLLCTQLNSHKSTVENYMKIFKLTDSQLRIIQEVQNEVEVESKPNFVMYAFVQLYDQNNKKTSTQFPIPFGAKSEAHT